jgi:peptidoglycan-associated lipoprotein
MTLRLTTLPIACLLCLLAACSTTAERGSNAPVAAAPTAPPAPAAPPQQAAPSSTVTTVTLPAHLDGASPLMRDRSIFFDYDDVAIKSEYNALIERHGRYLSGRAELAIKLEGHADERGSAEYNLSLGQKRAEAVLRALRLQGATTAQLEAVSWGEERPRAPGHDEAAWAQNRRVDLEYPKR